MKSRWKQYLFYACLIIVGGSFVFILIETVKAKNTGFEVKTLWDWMDLLIIPLVLAIGAFYLNRSERTLERQIAEDRAKLEREIATDRQQEAALQAYLDRMTELLLEKKLIITKNKEVRNVARIRTLTILRGLDPTRKGLVLRFLQEANLINKKNPIVDLVDADIHKSFLLFANLSYANLNHVDLSFSSLGQAWLEYTNLSFANLNDADLNGANLFHANLSNTNLDNANLRNAHLVYARLGGANLRNVNLTNAVLVNASMTHSNLSGANLSGANLEHADLSGVILTDAVLTDVVLTDANLEKATLANAKVTNEQLATVKSLKGAVMPDGTKHK